LRRWNLPPPSSWSPDPVLEILFYSEYDAGVPVKTKSIYEPAGPDDGMRVLATNYWPRGISRERAGTYMRVLAPSRPLLRAFKDGAIDWPEYETRFMEEMQREVQQAALRDLTAAATTATVTIMCVCKDEAHCHRRLLRELIERSLVEVTL
jgi:uncharacterized protein YeaO (DUF488 family)